jgi:hypothetical protein
MIVETFVPAACCLPRRREAGAFRWRTMQKFEPHPSGEQRSEVETQTAGSMAIRQRHFFLACCYLLSDY